MDIRPFPEREHRDKAGRFVAGHPGGPGRGKSQLNKYRELLDARTPEVITKLTELAVGGDVAAIRIYMDRVLPPAHLANEELRMQIDELREALAEAQKRLAA